MNSGWLCGEVNSQNAYGGYVGYKRFMSAGANMVYIDGIGYAGVKTDDLDDAHLDDTLESLDFAIAILKENNKLGVASDDEEVSRLSKERFFEKRWVAHCKL